MRVTKFYFVALCAVLVLMQVSTGVFAEELPSNTSCVHEECATLDECEKTNEVPAKEEDPKDDELNQKEDPKEESQSKPEDKEDKPAEIDKKSGPKDGNKSETMADSGGLITGDIIIDGSRGAVSGGTVPSGIVIDDDIILSPGGLAPNSTVALGGEFAAKRMIFLGDFVSKNITIILDNITLNLEDGIVASSDTMANIALRSSNTVISSGHALTVENGGNISFLKATLGGEEGLRLKSESGASLSAGPSGVNILNNNLSAGSKLLFYFQGTELSNNVPYAPSNYVSVIQGFGDNTNMFAVDGEVDEILSSPDYSEDSPKYKAISDLKMGSKQIDTWYEFGEHPELELFNMQKGDSDGFKSELQKMDDKTAVYLPTGGDTLYLPDSGQLNCSIYSLRGYEADTIGLRPEVDNALVLKKDGPGELNINGDMNWFNGVVDISHGKTIIHNEGTIFGGQTNVNSGAKLEWQGGCKNENNKPQITLNKATLDFEIDDIFSFYGSIDGDEDSRLNMSAGLTSGMVMIKGDGSNFHGTSTVDPETELRIRNKAGVYQGKMFGGTMNIKNTGSATIDTNYGLGPLTLSEGNLNIINNANKDDTFIDQFKISTGASAHINLDNVILSEAAIQGDLTLNDGNSAKFESVDIDGGMLTFKGKYDNPIEFHGKTTIGSGIRSTTTEHENLVFATDSSLNVYPGRTATVDIPNGTLELGSVNVPDDSILDVNVTSKNQHALKLNNKVSLSKKSVLKATGVGSDIIGDINVSGGKIYALDKGIDGTSKSFKDMTVQGHGAGKNAGTYSPSGARTPFFANTKNVTIDDEKQSTFLVKGNTYTLKADVNGLKDLTKTKGKVMFQYSTDSGKSWKNLSSKAVKIPSSTSTSGKVTLAYKAKKTLKEPLIRAKYEPGNVDNYSAGKAAFVGDAKGSGGGGNSTGLGRTGDNGMPWLWAVLFVLCAATIVIRIYTKKRA